MTQEEVDNMTPEQLELEFQLCLLEIEQCCDNFKLRYLFDNIYEHGFKFGLNDDILKFILLRVTIVPSQQQPGTNQMYVDYGTPNEVLLEEYNAITIEDIYRRGC